MGKPNVIYVPPGGSYVGQGSGGGVGGTYVAPGGSIISAGRGSTVGSTSPTSSGYSGGYEGTSTTTPEQLAEIRKKEEEQINDTALADMQRSVAQKKTRGGYPS